MDKNIKAFFDDRKSKKGEDINEYLPKLLSNIEKYVVFTSHCYKYTNPKIKTKINIWNKYEQRPDGYIRSGNYGEVKEDAVINATFLPCIVFLNLKLDDGKTVLQHLKENTKEARDNFSNLDVSYDYIRNVILNIKYGEKPTTTHNNLRQVYFPVENDQYHILSILYPATGVFYLKNKYREFYFSDNAKEVKELRKKGLYTDQKIHELFDLVEIKYGGSKPQNISYLNNVESGTSYLFSSIPPTLQRNKITLPKRNFFFECLRKNKFYNEFSRLNFIFKDKRNNIEIRNERDDAILNIFDKIIENINIIRLSERNWSNDDKYNSLPEYQKIILDSQFEEFREVEILDQFILEISRWIIYTYKSYNFKSSSNLGDIELNFINTLLLDNKEVLL